MSLSDRLRDEEPIHQTENFAVCVGTLSQGDWKGNEGYLVINKRTNVVEGELTVEFAAIRTLRELETELEAALENKQAEVKGEVSFEDMLAKLAEKHGETSSGE